MPSWREQPLFLYNLLMTPVKSSSPRRWAQEHLTPGFCYEVWSASIRAVTEHIGTSQACTVWKGAGPFRNITKQKWSWPNPEGSGSGSERRGCRMSRNKSWCVTDAELPSSGCNLTPGRAADQSGFQTSLGSRLLPYLTSLQAVTNGHTRAGRSIDWLEAGTRECRRSAPSHVGSDRSVVPPPPSPTNYCYVIFCNPPTSDTSVSVVHLQWDVTRHLRSQYIKQAIKELIIAITM